MTLIQLKYFQVVCQLGSFTKAANQLAVSQPAISLSIKELESEFGTQLLFRDGKVVQPTEAGQIFLLQCNSLLQHAERTCQLMSDIAKQKRPLRFGTTPALALVLLPQMYRDFVRQNPDVPLVVVEGSRAGLQNQMDQHQLDAILVNSYSNLETAYRQAHITDFNYHFCVSKEHPLADRPSITIQEVGESPLVCFGRGYQQIQFLQQIFAPYHLEPNIVYETGHLSTISGMIRYNQLGTFLYQTLAPQWPDLRFIPVTPPISASINLFWRHDSMNHENIRRLLKCLKSLSY